MIENIRSLPVEEVIGGITSVATIARDADAELTLALAYAHRVMSPPLSLRVLSSACGLSPSTIRARVQAPGVLDQVRAHIERSGQEAQGLPAERSPTPFQDQHDNKTYTQNRQEHHD